MALGRHRYDVVAEPRLTEVRRDGKPLLRVIGARVVVRDLVEGDGSVSFTVNPDGDATLTAYTGPGKPRQILVPEGTTDESL